MTLYCAYRGQSSGSAAVYALLRYAVSKNCCAPMPAVAKQPTGKPYFPDRPDIHFSLSHTRTHVLCAISDYPVGVDIETIRPVRLGVPERVCTPEELSMFDFFELWVLKESFIKRTGNTSVILKNIQFRRQGGRIITPDSSITARLFDTVPGCCAAICSQGAPLPDRIEMIE